MIYNVEKFIAYTAHMIIFVIFFFLHYFLSPHCISARSPFRIDRTLPSIKVKNKDSTHTFLQTDSHLEYYPFFETYNEERLMSHSLPSEAINHFFAPHKQFSGAHLQDDLEYMIKEIRDNKRKFKQFKVIHDENFNYGLQCGLLIVKHKKIPIVAKIFIERPETLVHPSWKGFGPGLLFYMAGGINRHFAGFTRIPNRDYIEEWATHNPKWKHKIILPRKWFWLPADPQWMKIEGENMYDETGKRKITASITIPGTYVIIADNLGRLKNTKHLMFKREQIIIDFCNDIELNVDPHESNFIVTYNKKNHTIYLAIIDTEHFPTMVGLNEKEHLSFKNHFEWLLYLASKCLQDTYFRPKSMRLGSSRQRRRFPLK